MTAEFVKHLSKKNFRRSITLSTTSEVDSQTFKFLYPNCFRQAASTLDMVAGKRAAGRQLRGRQRQDHQHLRHGQHQVQCDKISVQLSSTKCPNVVKQLDSVEATK
jgi:hypothetical protein